MQLLRVWLAGRLVTGAAKPRSFGKMWLRRMNRSYNYALAVLALTSGLPAIAQVTDFRLSQAVQVESAPASLVAYLDAWGESGVPVEELSPDVISATLGGQALELVDLQPHRSAGGGVAYIFSVDISRSLSRAQFEGIRRAIDGWFGRLRPEDRAALISFGDRSEVVVDFTGEVDVLRQALLGLGPTDGSTVLYQGIYDAVELSSRRDEDLPGRRVLVVLSDGLDEGSGLTAEDVLATLEDRSLPLYALGFGGSARRDSLDLLLRLATNSGGSFIAVDGFDFEGAYDATREIIERVWVAELRCDTCPTDGSQQRLQVNLNVGGRVLSKGLDMRLLAPLDATAGEPDGGASPVTPVADVEDVMEPSQAETARGADGIDLRLWLAIGGGVLLAALAAYAIGRRRSGGDSEDEEVPRRRPVRAKMSRRERKLNEVPIDSKPPATAVSLRLVVVRGSSRGHEYRFLLREEGILGSGKGSDFTVAEEPGVAAQHVALYQESGSVYARNLAKREPMLLNGAALDQPQPIKSGDLLGNKVFIARIVLG